MCKKIYSGFILARFNFFVNRITNILVGFEQIFMKKFYLIIADIYGILKICVFKISYIYIRKADDKK